ncbi:MAG: transglycosylase domain-containing protein [Desulfomonile tiedjei]|uniref:Transglycosylase domain-containing protein n=1 Tax=Desulfomonile tiedjei TaxID=2358 RepID=A0A9D6YZR5_9BACT|nr:transglycosylase domain-containing protein [Desulfomonile tiedjei]
MASKPKKVLGAIVTVLKILAVLLAVYLLITVIAVVWAFEAKLNRWPVFVYTAPFTLRVGDDIFHVKLTERLSRLGYSKASSAVPEGGQWSETGTAVNISLNYSPFRSRGIISGPVSVNLDWNRVSSIRLMRSLEDVNTLVLEPELLTILPASGGVPEFCRPVPLEKIPPLLVDAIILTEDTRFFSHQGIDLMSMGQAFMTNVKAGRYVHGASTIPQQLIRMTLLNPEKTMLRKVNEILLAVAADAIYSKKTLLLAYLNRVYFGQWGHYPVRGVAEAARCFFGKDLMELDSAECALMAATIRAPNVINPLKHPERAKSRRNMILGLLFKAGRISRDDYEEAVNAQLNTRRPNASYVKAPAFVDLVKEYLPKDLPDAGGARQDVLTSLDPVLQNESDHVLKGFGDAGSVAHLLIANPETGNLKAFIAASTQKWAGNSSTADTFLPLIMIPALIPEKVDQAKYTLTSQVFVSPQSGPLTFREAYRKERQALFQKLSETLGNEKIVPVLKEFGIQTRIEGDKLALESMSPTEVAQVYSLMATLGSAGVIGPGIKIVGDATSEKEELRIRIPTNPAVVFLVNHAMKGIEIAEFKGGDREKSRAKPSRFRSRDNEGVWEVAYNSNSLILLRMPGGQASENKIKKAIDKLLEESLTEEGQTQPPDGIVFRNICVESGLRATSICPKVIREPFLKGTQPSEWCPHRHESGSLKSAVRQ